MIRSFPVALVATMFAWPACADSQIRAVTLSTAGLAMIEAGGTMNADGLKLTLRRDDVDDFLKSLRLSDPSGAVPRLSMTGPGGVSDVFAALPFGPDALGDLRVLLDAMIGAPVEAERRGVLLSGRIMGSREVPCGLEGVRACVALSLRTDDGRVSQLALDDAATIRFADPSDRAAIDRGLAALRAAATSQRLEVSITSTDPAPREVVLGWLQPAPVWKTAWRAESGEHGLVLTGWAVIENTSGHDWVEVDLTLATGAVRALRAQLYERSPAARKLAASAPRESARMLAAPMASIVMSAEADMAVAPVDMDDGDSFSRFTLATPVTLAAGDMMSLPFLRETLDDARLTLYRGGSGAVHPMIALEFENPLPLRLPAGVLTLYEAGRGHAGDAMMPELSPGARETVEFARDDAVRVSEDVREGQTLHSLRIVDGVMVSEERMERRTVYRLEGAADRARLVTISHPLRPDWKMLTEGGVAGFDATRFVVTVEAGGLARQEVVETRLRETRIGLLDLDREALAFWRAAAADERIGAMLARLQSLRTEEAELRGELRRLAAREAQLVADQERLVGLIVQLGDDSPATRERRVRVDEIDGEITKGRDARQTAESRLERISVEMRSLIRTAG